MRFPNFKNKYAHDALVTPQEFLAYQKSLGNYPRIKPPEGIIICYSRSLMRYILKSHKTKKVKGFSGEMYVLKETGDRIAVIGNFGIGAPIVVTHIEELIAFGISKFISIGTAGALQKNLNLGDVVVCSKAIRDEGSSYHYLKPSKFSQPSQILTKQIARSLKKSKMKFRIGPTWTIDTPYRETVAEARHYQKEGVLTVEMEASALFAVAQYRQVQIGAIFTISDSLAELEWKPGFHVRKGKSSLEKVFRAAIQVFKLS